MRCHFQAKEKNNPVQSTKVTTILLSLWLLFNVRLVFKDQEFFETPPWAFHVSFHLTATALSLI